MPTIALLPPVYESVVYKRTKQSIFFQPINSFLKCLLCGDIFLRVMLWKNFYEGSNGKLTIVNCLFSSAYYLWSRNSKSRAIPEKALACAKGRFLLGYACVPGTNWEPEHDSFWIQSRGSSCAAAFLSILSLAEFEVKPLPSWRQRSDFAIHSSFRWSPLLLNKTLEKKRKLFLLLTHSYKSLHSFNLTHTKSIKHYIFIIFYYLIIIIIINSEPKKE